ncbi:MAG TPA: fatty acid desaturase [Solirubrobacterales bacterium]|nr:fatty acid desaturase [Solirubrobacterales bacterium]
MPSAATPLKLPADRDPASPESSAAPDLPDGDALWRRELAPYAQPSPWRTALDLLTAPVAYLALWPVMVLALDVSYWLTLAISVLAAGFLLRTFIVFHDCTHGSLFRSRGANRWVGRFTGLLVLHPFANWRHSHAVHHGSAGDLDRRGAGDVMTMTVAEFRAASPGQRRLYRAFRNPLVMFGLGPFWSLVIQPRIPPKGGNKALRNSVWLTNLAVAVTIGAVCLAIGWQEYLMIQIPMIFIAGSAGVWLFFVQHQFEDVYWENTEDWSYADAALRGSSHLKLPQPLQFFTGNIGLHHVHHLSSRVPNYNLQAANDNVGAFADVPVLTFWESMRCSRFKLIDERTGKLLTYKQARELDSAPEPTPSPAA